MVGRSFVLQRILVAFSCTAFGVDSRFLSHSKANPQVGARATLITDSKKYGDQCDKEGLIPMFNAGTKGVIKQVDLKARVAELSSDEGDLAWVPIISIQGFEGWPAADTSTSAAATSQALRNDNSGCNRITTEAECMVSKDGRKGKSYSDSPCRWCCGAACTTNNANKCEPQSWLLQQSNYVGRSKNGLGDDTCNQASGNIVTEKAPGVGAWGGSCTCPNGQQYWVGDHNDSCGSLACINGVSGKCTKGSGKWSHRKVVCQVFDSGKVYNIENANAAGKYLNVDGNSKNNGANIQLWDNPSEQSTQWKIISRNNGVYNIENVNADGKYMNVAGNSKDDGADIQLWENPSEQSTQWKIISRNNGVFNIENVNAAGKYVNVAGNRKSNGANVQLWNNPSEISTQWRITEAPEKEGDSDYTLVGNGWCTNSGKRIGIKANWQTTTIRSNNGADLCEQQCSADQACIGYQTEDGSKCQLMPGNTHGSVYNEIQGVDSETRNYCWRKVQTSTSSSGSKEATSFWHSSCQRIDDMTRVSANVDETVFTMTHSKCFTRCKRQTGMRYFAVSNGAECFCSESPPGQVIGDEKCKTPCSGNIKEICGGGISSIASVYTMVNCEPFPSSALNAEYKDKLLNMYSSWEGQSCGEADDNGCEINGSPKMSGNLEECKMACWEAQGANECHGFTFDSFTSQCTFSADVADGKIRKKSQLACYFKKMGY